MDEPPLPEPEPTAPATDTAADSAPAVQRTVTVENPVDRKRDAGLRGEEFSSAAWLLGIVFLTGIAVLVAVLLTRKKRDA